jgi:hypothetical protein
LTEVIALVGGTFSALPLEVDELGTPRRLLDVVRDALQPRPKARAKSKASR